MMDIDLTPLGEGEPESTWFEYDEDDDPDPEKRVALELIGVTPLIQEECAKKATPKPVQVNGRFRRGRNIEMPTMNFWLYQRLIFQRCVKNWRNLKNKRTGEVIPCDEPHKAAVSEANNGLLQFGYDMAVALGEMSVEQIEKERARFRNVDQIPARLSEPELSDV